MQAATLAIQAVTTVATSQRSRTLARFAICCACFCLGEIAGMSRVGIALRDIVTDRTVPALLALPGITDTGIVGSSTIVSGAATRETFFLFKCSPCTVFCQ